LAALAVLAAALPGPASDRDRPADDPDANRRLLDFYRQDPGQTARLRHNLAVFRSLPPERQAQLRKLDRELYAEPPSARARMERALDRYSAWVDRLDEGDRRKLGRAATTVERLILVKELRDAQFRARLSPEARDRLERFPAELENWQKHARWLRQDWRFLARAGDGVLEALRDAVADAEFRGDLLAFGRGPIHTLLTPEERARLEFAEREARQHDNWLTLARAAGDLSARHPLPRLPGPAKFLPDYLKAATELSRRVHAAGPALPRLRPVRFKDNPVWPEAAEELAVWAHKHGVTAPRELGPCNLDELAHDCGDAVRPFVQGRLARALTPAEKKELEAVEKRWPDYPQAVERLAHAHGLKVPGMELPGPAKFWDAFRPGRFASEFPDPPARLLTADFLQELARPDSRAAGTSPTDPADRELIKKDYFLRHPEELARLRALEVPRK
jgi:hypothetical protein